MKEAAILLKKIQKYGQYINKLHRNIHHSYDRYVREHREDYGEYAIKQGLPQKSRDPCGNEAEKQFKSEKGKNQKVWLGAPFVKMRLWYEDIPKGKQKQ